MNKFEERITRIEQLLRSDIAGTQLYRSLNSITHQLEWTLALGDIAQPKELFTAVSLTDLFMQVEETLLSRAVTNMPLLNIPTLSTMAPELSGVRKKRKKPSELPDTADYGY